MNTISRVELLIYSAIYCSLLLGLHLHCAKTDVAAYKDLPRGARRIVRGFYNTIGTDYNEIESYFVMGPYLACLFVACLLVNLFNVPYKIQVVELLSVGLMIRLYGYQLMAVIVAISILLATTGRCLRGTRILPQLVGLLVIGLIEKILEYVPRINFSWYLHSSSLAYAGFFSQVVRAMMVCCDYAKLQEPTGWGQLLSESIGFQAMAGVFMPASFVVFTDWQRWRNGEFKFVWSKPFHLAPEKRVGSATVLRTLSFWRLSGHAAKIAFWTAVHKYLLCSIDIIGVVIGPTQRILTDHGTPMDWVIICFTCYTFLVRFTLFYVIFYELSRLVGDFQQFLLSPAFSPNTLELVRGDPLAAKFWKQASLVERWIRVEVTVECLMPEGPCCTMIAFTSSEIWRFFDTGLYNVLKHYIYIPWMEVVTMVTYGNKDNLRGQTSPVVQNIAAVFGAVFTFLFVLTFHGWNKGNYVWVTISFVLWMIERFVAKANRTYALSDNLSKRLGAAWEQRIRCAACSGLQMINLLSFSFFVTSYDSAWFLVDSTPARPYVALPFWFVLYCSLQMKIGLMSCNWCGIASLWTF